jgi:prevent-host-death family protein
MSTTLTIRELQERLPELLDHAVQTGEEYLVQRNGKDCAVVVSACEWKRRTLGKSTVPARLPRWSITIID